jgi:hypothetical protein
MDLKRERLERIDRKLLARLGEDEAFQMVRVPVAAAKWATWKRYCVAAGTSMGRAIVALIDRELGLVDGSTMITNLSLAATGRKASLSGRWNSTLGNVNSPPREIEWKPRPNGYAAGGPSCGPSNTT